MKHICINSLLPGIPFLFPIKTLENLWLSDVFRGYKEGTPGSYVLNMATQ